MNALPPRRWATSEKMKCQCLPLLFKNKKENCIRFFILFDIRVILPPSHVLDQHSLNAHCENFS